MTSGWSENFANQSKLDTSLFSVHWGNSNEFSFGSKGITLTSNGNAVGVMTPDLNAADSYGYGLYQVTFAMPADQPSGAYICLWPASNAWPGPEIDFVEQRNGGAYLTVHWKGTGNTNQSQSTYFTADVSQSTTIALNWEANSLTFYVDGKEVLQYLSGGTVPVPKDYANGGENEAFGIGNVGPKGTSVTVSSMSFAPSTGNSTIASTRIVVSAPGKLQESSVGAGVTTPISISDPGLTHAYVMVMNSNNVGEAYWTRVSLDASGKATYDAHFEHSGDYLLVVNDPSTQTDRGVSSPVTITDPTVVASPTIKLSGPGTLQETYAGAGVTTPVTISDPGLTHVYALVMNSENIGEENWIPVNLNSSGQATYDFHFEKSGDYLLVVNDPFTQADRGVSSPVTITDPVKVPSHVIGVSSPGMQFVGNAATGATVPITISDPGLKEVYAFVMNSLNVAEQNWIAIPLNAAGQATYGFHFQHSGDYVLAVNDPATQTDRGVSGHISILQT